MTDLEHDLYESLFWALPLAKMALEDCRQTRLRNGRHDIGAGTEKVGLWPFEVSAMERCELALARARSEIETPSPVAETIATPRK